MAEHLKDNLTTHVSLLVISHAKQHDEIAQQNAEIVKQNGELKVAKAEIATLVEEKKTLQSKTEGLGHNFNLLTENSTLQMSSNQSELCIKRRDNATK